MIDIAKDNVYRAARKNIYNAWPWSEVVFRKGQILHCIHDAGTIYFARPIGSSAVPSMIYKEDCRELTETEKRQFKI